LLPFDSPFLRGARFSGEILKVSTDSLPEVRKKQVVMSISRPYEHM